MKTDFSQWVGIENRIADSISQTADELAHAECFDEEQRAEIYAILQALRTDTDTHKKVVSLLAGKDRDGVRA